MNHFLKDQRLVCVNIDDCEEGMRLGDICVMQDRTSEFRPFIIVKRERDGKLKQIDKNRFQHHVIEMAICEVPYLQLHVNQLYRFVVVPTCEICLDLERELKK